MTFLFSNIKTSILDTAAAGYQKELHEDYMKNSLKTDSVNLAYSSKRKENSAAVVFKKDAKPWRESTVAPYLRRNNLESLTKSMPFLQKKAQQRERLELVERDLFLKSKYVSTEDRSGKISIAAAQYSNLKSMEMLNSIIARKASMTNMFFNKINSTFDIQKKEIYNYYKNVKEEAQENMEHAAPELPDEDI